MGPHRSAGSLGGEPGLPATEALQGKGMALLCPPLRRASLNNIRGSLNDKSFPEQ